mmetsp:Transcript_11509/g.32321  ORF Transcript_11509/g.32321 Transcript_11509/m.32321 type:complete len:229 (-) Transcript_11509:468-1154(-)
MSFTSASASPSSRSKKLVCACHSTSSLAPSAFAQAPARFPSDRRPPLLFPPPIAFPAAPAPSSLHVIPWINKSTETMFRANNSESTQLGTMPTVRPLRFGPTHSSGRISTPCSLKTGRPHFRSAYCLLSNTPNACATAGYSRPLRSLSMALNPNVGMVFLSGDAWTTHSESIRTVQTMFDIEMSFRVGSPGPGSRCGSVPARKSLALEALPTSALFADRRSMLFNSPS